MTTSVKTTLRIAVSCAISAGAAAAILGAPISAADPIFPTPGAGAASDAISSLQAQGFDVQINWLQGHPNVPLSECRVNGIHNPGGSMASTTSLSTVYLDVACPNAK